MRIGILTFHRAINYGAVMQAYALQQKIQKDFPNDIVEIVDYNHKIREKFILKCPLVFLYRRSIQDGIKKIIQTYEFRKSLSYLVKGKSFLGCSTLKIEKHISEYYDVIIVGSDAVFNWNDIGLPNPYFLEGVTNTKKLSYAASVHLQKYFDNNKKQQLYLMNSLSDFEYLGVRDDNTARFVNSILDEEKTEHNCDPTIFLELDFDEMNLMKKLKKAKFSFEKKTVFVMLMHQEYGKYVKDFFGDECQIVALMDGNKWSDIYMYNLNPFEWAKIFRYGMCLVTDYFHGTIFGLKNGLPVLSIDASEYCKNGYESKAYDLLYKRLNLPLYYSPSSSFADEDGFSVFSNKMRDILKNHNKETVKQALQKEATSYNTFKSALENLHTNH